MERVKREQIASIVSSEQSAMGLLGRNLRHFLFGKGSYAHRNDGDPAVVAKYTAKDVAAFWNRQKRVRGCFPWRATSTARRWKRL